MSQQLYLGTSPNCGHCTVQKKDIRDAVQNNELPENGIVIVDCTDKTLSGDELVVCQKATAYPSWHRDGKEIARGAGRDAATICNDFGVCPMDTPYLMNA